MNCPKCNYPNKAGATHCSLCQDVFNRSAADRYVHAQRKARMQEDPSYVAPGAAAQAPPSVVNSAHSVLSEINWLALWVHGTRPLKTFLQTYPRLARNGLLVVALGAGVLYFASPTQRLRLLGNRLTYAFSPRQPITYSVGFHTELKSWSERGGRLDTPLETFEHNEVGNVTVVMNQVDRKTRRVVFQPKEWIVTQTDQLSQSIPPNHPSLKAGAITLNARGQITTRASGSPTRMGRALPFLAPRWPVGSQRVGAHWDEPVEWVDTISSWKILWKGKLHWKVTGTQTWYNKTYLHLTYTADVHPALWEAPAWARGAVKAVSFQGATSGDALFDPQEHQVFSNDFIQDGTLSIPINNIYRIPADLRVGRLPRHRWGTAVPPEPGTLILQIKNRLGIHKS